MKEIQYKDFSLKTHQKNWKINRPNVCQFELTFDCGLHCQHCYTDCYNKPKELKRELNTRQIKSILDRVYSVGVIWLCFTGGDPLTRPDFLELYSYAKDKGFIITIFTSCYSLTKTIVNYLKTRPPFVIEMTLNAVTKGTYEEISQVKDSFSRVMNGIKLIRKAKLPLKIKTQITKENLKELPAIEKFVKGIGLRFRPSVFLHCGLDQNLTPANLRIPPTEVLHLDGKQSLVKEDCRVARRTLPAARRTSQALHSQNLFPCAIGGGDGIYIDPYGNIVPCDCIREPKVSLLETGLFEAREKILGWVRARRFNGEVKCRTCSIRGLCHNCPGKALLEKGKIEGIVDWYCEMAHLEAGLSSIQTTAKLSNC